MVTRVRVPRRVALAAILTALAMAGVSAGSRAPQPLPDPSLDAVIARMAAYVAAYGEKTSLLVASERYTQQVEVGGIRRRPRTLIAEFAIVKANDRVGWTGFRDVVEVDGKAVADRRDRLVTLLTGPASGDGELRRLADESARYNVGVVARNLNVPTTALFFFHPEHVGRFVFTRSGTKTIDGVETWALTFKETRRPTLVMRRDGTDVPSEGKVWVVPADGTVVRTRLRLRDFANQVRMTEARDGSAPRRMPEYVMPTPPQPAPAPPPPAQAPPPTTPGQPSTGGAAAPGRPQRPSEPEPREPRDFSSLASFGQSYEIKSLADIDVTYRRDAASGMWLPAKMSETYEGALTRATPQPVAGRTIGLAQYSDFRRFETSVRVKVPQ